jgi:hypothetical protein
MVTTLFEVKFHNGSKFNVFCSGIAQVKRFRTFTNMLKDEIESIKELTNGIHTISQFEKITTNKL